MRTKSRRKNGKGEGGRRVEQKQDNKDDDLEESGIEASGRRSRRQDKEGRTGLR